MNKQEALEALKENSWEFETNYFKYELVIDLKDAQEIVSQIDEPQKVTVPKFVLDWVDNSREHSFYFDEWLDYDNQPSKVYDWLNPENKRQAELNTLALVTLIVNGANAVEIEQEKLYTVEIAEAILTKITRGRNVQYKMLPSRDVSDVFDNAIYCITRLTEKEIKKADERLWQFAKEVE